MSSKPIIVFVPGAWHTPEYFELVEMRLKSAGYQYFGVRTPSVRKEPPFPKDGGDDVDAVRDTLNSAIGDGNDVVVVMHSYGGIPGSAACKGMSKEDRIKEGKKGGVIKLVYIASFALPEGANLSGGTGTKEGEQGLAEWCIPEVKYQCCAHIWLADPFFLRAITRAPNVAKRSSTTISRTKKRKNGYRDSNTTQLAHFSHLKFIRPSNLFPQHTLFANWTTQSQLLSKR
jgi:hypothetical protein